MPADAAAGVSDATLIAASVRLRVEDANGHSCGSGTIIDARDGQALILTCGHIFRDSKGKGQIEVDLFSPSGQQRVPGQLISYTVPSLSPQANDRLSRRGPGGDPRAGPGGHGSRGPARLPHPAAAWRW